MDANPDATTLFPIRELAQQTGVNTVTLRAWERRYGLLKPARTGKGHRLYTQADVERIKQIQSWLARGVAVSQVKAILNDDDAPARDVVNYQIWRELRENLQTALVNYKRSSLEHLIDELTALYPTAMLADWLIIPVIDNLVGERSGGAETRLALLRTVLTERMYMRQARQRQQAKGKRLCLIKLSRRENDLLPLMLNNHLLIRGFRTEYLEYLSPPEWLNAVDMLDAEAVLLYGDSASSLPFLQEELQDWQKTLRVPLFISGKIVSICAAYGDEHLNRFLTSDKHQVVAEVIVKELQGSPTAPEQESLS